MLNNARVYPTIPVIDIARAKEFYQEKLGLKLVMEDPAPGAVLQAGKGTGLYLYQRAATKADHTVAAFSVDDFGETIKHLRTKGVQFENIDMPGIKTIDGVATISTPDGGYKDAWFKDTEGNILAVNNVKQ